jgi:hypothetical protein
MAVRDDANTRAGRDEGSTPALLSNKLQRFASQHVALIVPFIGVVIFAIRCTVVSRGDPNTAAILIAEASIEDAIQVVVLWVLPALLTALIFIIAWSAGEHTLARGLFDPVTIALALTIIVLIFGALFLGGLLTAPGWFGFKPAIAAVLFLILCIQLAGFAQIRLRQIKLQAASSFRIRLFLVIAAAEMLVAILLPLFHPRFWLPPEKVTFKDEAPFTGYLLEDSADYLVIFEERRRVLTERPKVDLVRREFCDLSRANSESRDLPKCP